MTAVDRPKEIHEGCIGLWVNCQGGSRGGHHAGGRLRGTIVAVDKRHVTVRVAGRKTEQIEKFDHAHVSLWHTKNEALELYEQVPEMPVGGYGKAHARSIQTAPAPAPAPAPEPVPAPAPEPVPEADGHSLFARLERARKAVIDAQEMAKLAQEDLAAAMETYKAVRNEAKRLMEGFPE